MILDSDLPELRTYRSLEKSLSLEFAPELARLVISGDSDSLPVHRWFKYKEAYSPALLWQLLPLIPVDKGEPLSLLDPFCGVGTTLVSAQMDPKTIRSVIGIERNPFSAFVARTKIAWPKMDLLQFEAMEREVLERTRGLLGSLPSLSSIQTGRCISRYIAARLVAIRDSILAFPDSPERNALLVGVASAIEPLSHVRKDGRALRLVERPIRQLLPVVRSKWKEIKSDILKMSCKPTIKDVQVIEGDGRRLHAAGVRAGSVDVVVTSPPYPNNIDYSEVYKLELWIMGFIDSAEEFLRLRKSTLRSHPTSDLSEEPDSEFLSAIEKEPLCRCFGAMLARTESFKQSWRTRLALGYFSDIWVSLREQHRSLRKGGHVFMVVANSLHGSADNAYLIPTDLLVGQIGCALGFELVRILVARSTRRRLSGNHFLRESIVMLRKRDVE